MTLIIKNLKANVDNQEILKGVDLTIKKGEVHILMGQNGSGKSTLAQVLMGNPTFEVTSGSINFNNSDILKLSPNERSQQGIFLSFQYPSEIEGLGVSSFLRAIHNKLHNEKLSMAKFRKILIEKMAILGMDESFMSRYLNEGFSGGEKKRMEMLQMLVAEPKLAILDETDSGLDVDALKNVMEAVDYLRKRNSDMTILIITHYTRILRHIEPDVVSIMQDGKIIKQGDKKLAHQLEEKGYAPFGE